VTGFSRRDATIPRPRTRPSARSRFGDLGGRLARTFSSTTSAELPGGPIVDQDQLPQDTAAWVEPILTRFPVVPQGYDCGAVDEHLLELEARVVELERELAQLQALIPSRSEVDAEIERIGQQTSKILVAAHDEARETVSRAQAEADGCIANAASSAATMIEDAKLERRRNETATASIRNERTRLIEDIQRTAAELASLANDAAARTPPAVQTADD